MKTPIGPCVGRNREADSTAALISSIRLACAASAGEGVVWSGGSWWCVMLAIGGEGRRRANHAALSNRLPRTRCGQCDRQSGLGLQSRKQRFGQAWQRTEAGGIAAAGGVIRSLYPPSQRRRRFDGPNALGHRLGICWFGYGREPPRAFGHLRLRSWKPLRPRHCGAAESVNTRTSSPVVGLMS